MLSGYSSVVEYNLAKVGVVGSNPIARSNLDKQYDYRNPLGGVFRGVCLFFFPPEFFCLYLYQILLK